MMIQLTAGQRHRVVGFQCWRNSQYAELAEERRRVANTRRHDAARSTSNPIYMPECASKSDSELRALEVQERRYGAICRLDTYIKSRYQAVPFYEGGAWHDPAELPVLAILLDQAEALMQAQGR